MSAPRSIHGIYTCSNEFYLGYLKEYWQKSADLRPSFGEIFDKLEKEVEPKPGDFFMYS
jgi:hypothetical protein